MGTPTSLSQAKTRMHLLKASVSCVALLGITHGVSAQTVITSDPATLNNSMTIDAGAGNEAPGIVVVGETDGTLLDIQNSGLIQGRGNADAGLAAAGDGIRLERMRVGGALDATTTSLFTGSITLRHNRF